MLPESFHIFAPAKINLFLHIVGKREDGYHILQSLMVFADVGDDLEFSAQDEFSVGVAGPFSAALSETKDNLVYQAARLLSEEYKVPLCGKIVLTKNLPVASGIGGGSTDAAAALRGLVKLWKLADDPARLHKVAQQLGADVPACLYGRAVLAEGVGEKLTPTPDMQRLHLVLVNPQVATPTPAVFKKFHGRFSEPVQTGHMNVNDLKQCRNDLTDAAISVTPEIKTALSALADTKHCLLHRLSGSGATCFGVYGDEAAAKTAAVALGERYPVWWVRSAIVG